MADPAQLVEDHKSLMLSTNGTIASMGLEKVAGKAAGILVTPAVWALNYSVSGAVPDEVDAGLFGLGLFGGAAGPAAIATGIIKSIVDDDIDQKLREIQAGENPKYREFIKACYRYAWSSPGINAMTIASKGGTAWRHTNGLWVYITDRNGLLVNDYKPNKAVEIYHPVLPLIRGAGGGLKWRRD